MGYGEYPERSCIMSTVIARTNRESFINITRTRYTRTLIHSPAVRWPHSKGHIAAAGGDRSEEERIASARPVARRVRGCHNNVKKSPARRVIIYRIYC